MVLAEGDEIGVNEFPQIAALAALGAAAGTSRRPSPVFAEPVEIAFGTIKPSSG